MIELSLSQKFFVCAVNSNGHISHLHSSTWTCLILSTLIDLDQQGCISLDDFEIIVTKQPPEQFSYLLPVINRINEQSPTTLEQFVGNYVTGLTETARQELFDAIGHSLIATKAADIATSVVPTPKVGFRPHQQQRDNIIDAIRAAFFPPQPDVEQIILASLLHHGKLTKNYFSRSEQKHLKETLAQYHNYSANEQLTTTLAQIDSVMNVPVIVTLIASTGN